MPQHVLLLIFIAFYYGPNIVSSQVVSSMKRAAIYHATFAVECAHYFSFQSIHCVYLNTMPILSQKSEMNPSQNKMMISLLILLASSCAIVHQFASSSSSSSFEVSAADATNSSHRSLRNRNVVKSIGCGLWHPAVGDAKTWYAVFCSRCTQYAIYTTSNIHISRLHSPQQH